MLESAKTGSECFVTTKRIRNSPTGTYNPRSLLTNQPRSRDKAPQRGDNPINQPPHLVEQEIDHEGTPAVHASVQVEEEEGRGEGVHGHAGTIQEPVAHRHHIQVLTDDGLVLQTEAPLVGRIA